MDDVIDDIVKCMRKLRHSEAQLSARV